MKKTITVQVNMMNLMCGMYMCGMIFLLGKNFRLQRFLYGLCVIKYPVL